MTNTPIADVLVKGIAIAAADALEHAIHRVGRGALLRRTVSCSSATHTARVPCIVAGGGVLKPSDWGVGAHRIGFSTDVLVKLGGVLEHRLHSCHLAGVPRPDVLVKIGGTPEHIVHILHVASVPRSDVLVKPDGVIEHIVHMRHPTGVPIHGASGIARGTTVVKIDDATVGAPEHTAHSCHRPRVPRIIAGGAVLKCRAAGVGHRIGFSADVLVKIGDVTEHSAHICHSTGVPRSDVLVKIDGHREHTAHICHSTGVPRIPSGRSTCGRGGWVADCAGASEHTGKIHPPRRWYAAGIDDRWCISDQIGRVAGGDLHVCASRKGSVHTGPGDGAPLFDFGDFGAITPIVKPNAWESGVGGGQDGDGEGTAGGVGGGFGEADAAVEGRSGPIPPIGGKIIRSCYARNGDDGAARIPFGDEGFAGIAGDDVLGIDGNIR